MQPAPGGKDEDAQLAKSMDRLEQHGRTHRHDDTRPPGQQVVEESIADSERQKSGKAWLKRRLNKLKKK